MLEIVARWLSETLDRNAYDKRCQYLFNTDNKHKHKTHNKIETVYIKHTTSTINKYNNQNGKATLTKTASTVMAHFFSE